MFTGDEVGNRAERPYEEEQMTRLLAALGCTVLLSACSDPALYTGFAVNSKGISVSPAVQGRVGGATVTVSP